MKPVPKPRFPGSLFPLTRYWENNEVTKKLVCRGKWDEGGIPSQGASCGHGALPSNQVDRMGFFHVGAAGRETRV